MNAVLSHPSVLKFTTQNTESKDISFSYKSTLVEVFQGLIADAVNNNKRVVVSSCNSKDLKQLFELISRNYKLAMLIDNEFVTKESINQWRLAYKKKSNVHKRMKWTGSEKSVNRYFTDTLDYYKETYQKETSSIWKMASMESEQEFQLYMPILEYCIPAHLFNGTDIEFNELSAVVQKFASIFKPEFNLLKQINYVDEYTSNYGENTDIPLEDLSRKTNELTILFLNNINTYKGTWKSQLQIEHRKAKQYLRSLNMLSEKLSAVQFENEKTGNLLDKLTSGIQTRTQKENFKYSIELEFDNLLDSFSSDFPKLSAEYAITEESTIEPNIRILKGILEPYIIEIQKQKQLEGQQQFNQLNAQNCPSIFTEILEELKHFYEELKGYNLLESIGTDKSFNLHSSYQYLLKVKGMIESLLLMNQIYPSYLSWASELNSLNNLEKLIINSLATQIPDHSHWPHIFKEYYLNILKSISKPAIDLNDSLDKFIVESDKQKEIKIESLNNLQHYLISNHIENLKSSNPAVYKKIFQKKFKDHSDSIYPMLADINELFPLCFIRKEILSQSDCSDTSWDLHIHVDLLDQNEIDTTVSPYGNEFVTLKYMRSADSQVTVDSHSHLRHRKIQTDEDNLIFCKTLSDKLSNYKHRIQIFNCGNLFIISFLDKLLNIKLLETNKHLTFKEFVLDNDLNYSLEDVLLNDASTIQILVQDRILDPTNSDTLKWQLYLIDLMKRAGMNVQSVSLAELMSGNDSDLLLTRQEEELPGIVHNAVSIAPEYISE